MLSEALQQILAPAEVSELLLQQSRSLKVPQRPVGPGVWGQGDSVGGGGWRVMLKGKREGECGPGSTTNQGPV